MRRRHRLLSIGMFCIVLVSSAVPPVRGQDSAPPDLQMLLNLDLFRSQLPHDESGSTGANSSDSTLDQIHTLDALGYFGNSNNVNALVGSRASGLPKQYAPPPSQENAE